MVQKEKSVMENTAEKKKKSNKLLRNIIIAVVCLAVLIGLYFLVEKMPGKSDGDDLSSSDYVTISEEDYNNIVKVSVENAHGSFTLIKNGDSWFSSDDDKIELSNDRVTSLLTSISTIVGNVIEEETEDFEKYGFSNPSASVSYELSDGKKISFVLGSETPSGSGYYMKTDNSNTVYVLPDYKCSSVLQQLKDFRNSDVLSVNSENIKNVTVTNKNGSFTIKKRSETDYSNSAMEFSSWVVTKPNVIAGNDEKIEQFLFTNMQLSAEEYFSDNPAEYSKYGLDNPSCTIEYVNNDGSSTVIKFGKITEGNIYVKLEGKNQIFSVPIGELNVTDIKALDVSSTLAILEKIDNVSSVIIETNGGTYEMKIDRSGDEEKYFLNDKSVKEDDFKALYQKIIGVTIEGAVSAAGSGDFVCQVTFKYLKDLDDKVVSFYTYQDRFASIIINGNLNYYTQLSQIQNIIDGAAELAK